LTTAEWITVACIGFFALLALLVFLRLLLRKGPPDWVEYRVGIYVERKPEKRALPPTTYWQPPSSEQPTAVIPPKDS
jgi:hypothetical protein